MPGSLCFRLPGQDVAFALVPKVAASSIRRILPKPTERMTAQQAQDDGCFVVAFVRHPLDRLVSAWADKCQPGGMTPRLKTLGFFEGMDFPAFVSHAAQHRDSDHHLRCQADFLMAGERLCVDYLGRFERLDQDWARVQAMFGLADLPHRNKSPRRGRWQRYYRHRELRIQAEKMYHRDLVLLGYSC